MPKAQNSKAQNSKIENSKAQNSKAENSKIDNSRVKNLAVLRKLMQERSIAAYIVPTDDFHGSEYVGEYFKCREFITGFTGSAGTAVIMQDKAGLWTDGRYFLQAEKELEGSGIELYKSGQTDVPTIEEFLMDNLSDGDSVGFDGRVMTFAAVRKLEKALDGKNITFSYEEDLIDKIWEERPMLSEEKAWLLPLVYAGKSREEKLNDVRESMNISGTDMLILTSLDDIAWLFNFRGNDVACNPVVLCYAVITKNQVILFTDKNKFDEEALAELSKCGAEIQPYNDIYSFAKNFAERYANDTAEKKYTVMLDDYKANYTLVRSIIGDARISRELGHTAIADIAVKFDVDCTALMKAVKNDTEIDNMRKTHVKDGVAMTKLIYWLKKQSESLQQGGILSTEMLPITELDVSAKIEELRREQDGYIGPSFESIAAYGANGAVIHYAPDEKSNVRLENKGFFLLDTGGTYMGGTTDVTRTIAMGELTEKQKLHYTAVLKGNIGVASAKFARGTAGIDLDGLARNPIKEIGEDYNHGTGHGVGYMLSVHEGPNSIRNRLSERAVNNIAFAEGMITSNEPGIYIEGEYGIRLETLVLCRSEDGVQCAEYGADAETRGDMLEFETLTLVPFDLDAVESEQLTASERDFLNLYHENVYKKIAPLLTEDEAMWLKKATRKI